MTIRRASVLITAVLVMFWPGSSVRAQEHEHPGSHGEEEDGGHTDSSSTEPKEGNDSLFLWRFGAGYIFEVGERLSLTPGISLDLMREEDQWVEAFVHGMTFGVGV